MEVLAMDIGGTAIKYALCDQLGNISAFEEIKTDAYLGGSHVIKLIKGIAEKYKYVQRIGIATAGQVDTNSGVIIDATQNIPGYKGINLRQQIHEIVSCPVYVENDVHAAAVGELVYGCGRVYDDFLCLTYGTGIGGGLVIARQLYKGSHGIAGQLGHITTHPGGFACTCGSAGCYESYASVSALLRYIKLQTGHRVNGREIFLRQNFSDYQVIIDDWIHEVVIGLKELVKIFDPPCIVLGGGIMNQSYIIEKIRSELFEQLPSIQKDIAIMGSGLGNKAGLLGAAYLCCHSF